MKIPLAQNALPRVALFVDTAGYLQVEPHFPKEWVCAIVGAAIRPSYIADLHAAASALGVPFLLQPRHNDSGFSGFIEDLGRLKPNRILSNSYSMILRPEILRIVDYAALNVHAALLPRNRGPNPTQWALINDDACTGVTIHYIDDELDTGAIIAQSAVRIAEEDTWASLRDKVVTATSELFRIGLADILLGLPAGVPQENSEATVNTRLNVDTPKLSPTSMSDRIMFNWIRAQVAPLKGAYVQRGQERWHIDRYVAMPDIAPLKQELAEWLERKE